MPDQLQLRGGTTTEHNSFTGALREVTVDTTKKTVVVHDGSSAGGTPLMKESGGNAASTVGIGVGGNNKLTINSDGHIDIASNLDCAAGIDITGNITATGDADINGGDLTVTGGEGLSASFKLVADQGDDNGDGWRLNSNQDDNDLTFANNVTGSYVDKLTIKNSGNIGINNSSPNAELAVGAVSGNAPHIDIGHTSGNRFKLGYEGNNCFLGASSSSGMFVFKNNVSSNGHPQADGNEVGRFDQNGRWLVGTSTPVMNESGFNEIVIAGKNEGAAIHLADNNNNVQAGMFTSDGGSGAFYIRTITNNPMAFRTNNTERMRIDSSGKVMIGATSASGKLHVEDSGEVLAYIIGNTSTAGSRLVLQNKNTTANSHAGVLGADAGGQTTAQILFYSADNATNEGYLTLETRPASGVPTERMRILSSGLVAIRTTSALINESGLAVKSGGNTCVFKAEGAAGHNPVICWNNHESGTRQQIQFGDGSSFGSRGSITTNGGNVTYGGTSDYRKKQDDFLITDGIEKIKLLKPKRFKWKNNLDLGICDGFFAHEVQETIPTAHAVTGTKDEVDSDNNPVYQEIDQSKLVPLLVAAVQELIGKVEALEAA